MLLGVVAPSRGGLVVHSDNLTLETKLKIYENTVLHISTYDIGPEGAIDKFKTHQTKPRKAYNHCPIRSCSWCFFPSFCWRVSSLWAPRRCMLPRCFPAGCWRWFSCCGCAACRSSGTRPLGHRKFRPQWRQRLCEHTGQLHASRRRKKPGADWVTGVGKMILRHWMWQFGDSMPILGGIHAVSIADPAAQPGPGNGSSWPDSGSHGSAWSATGLDWDDPSN